MCWSQFVRLLCTEAHSGQKVHITKLHFLHQELAFCPLSGCLEVEQGMLMQEVTLEEELLTCPWHFIGTL